MRVPPSSGPIRFSIDVARDDPVIAHWVGSTWGSGCVETARAGHSVDD